MCTYVHITKSLSDSNKVMTQKSNITRSKTYLTALTRSLNDLVISYV